jgi:1-acyl-sn-glycerol-3-phosphate acyltransferase
MAVKGRLIQRVHGHAELPWGTSPDEYRPEAVQGSLRKLSFLFGEGRYFPLVVDGWENVPPAPVLVVSNHSGGTTIPDAWGWAVSWYRHFGVTRPLHVLAHELVLATRATGEYFGQRGVLRGEPEIARQALGAWRRDVLVMPGGDQDTWRPYNQRYQVCFGGRTGYARLALRAGVPIVPVANAGAHETLIVLRRGRRIAEALGLHRVARATIFPIHLSLPWGLAVGPWPHLPPPTTLRYRVGAPIAPTWTGEGEPPEDAVAALDQATRHAMQGLLDRLRVEKPDHP